MTVEMILVCIVVVYAFIVGALTGAHFAERRLIKDFINPLLKEAILKSVYNEITGKTIGTPKKQIGE